MKNYMKIAGIYGCEVHEEAPKNGSIGAIDP